MSGERGMLAALREHWPEYLMEAAELGAFMLAACLAAVPLFDPASPIVRALPDERLRLLFMGAAMGGTAVLIIYSPWGKRSGAHFNPAVTLTFLRLGKIHGWDAAFYIVAHFVGGVAGVLLAALIAGRSLAAPGVDYVVTRPGPRGPLVAFAAEFVISFVLMLVVLFSANSNRLARYTGCLVGVLLLVYVPLEAPLSGMSMNPARTVASALPADVWTAWWVYFTAPTLAMLAAAEVFVRLRGAPAVLCAKLHHVKGVRCIFRCGYGQLSQLNPTEPHPGLRRLSSEPRRRGGCSTTR